MHSWDTFPYMDKRILIELLKNPPSVKVAKLKCNNVDWRVINGQMQMSAVPLIPILFLPLQNVTY